MATTVHEPPQIKPSRSPGTGGHNGWRNLVPADGDLRAVKDSLNRVGIEHAAKRHKA